MLDRLRAILAAGQEEHVISPDDAPDLYAEQRSAAMDEARATYQEHRDAVLDGLDQVNDALAELRTHEDELTVVEDVAANVAQDRQRAIGRFDPPEAPHAFHAAVADLVEGLQQVTPKEQKVLDRVGGPASQAFDMIRDLAEQVEQLGTFLDNEYQVVARYEQLTDLVEQLGDQQQELDTLQDELDAIDLDPLRADLETVEQELDALADDPRHDEKAAIQDEIADLEDDRDSYLQQIDTAMGQMERGLKKLLYAARNGDIQLDSEHLQILEAVKDGRLGQEYTPPAADVAAAVSAADAAITQVDLGDRQQEKFHTGAETLQDIDELREAINDLSEQIAAKQEELDAYSLAEEREELQREQERLEDRIADRAEQRNTLRQEVRETEAAIADTRQQIADLLNDALDADVTVVPQDADDDDTGE